MAQLHQCLQQVSTVAGIKVGPSCQLSLQSKKKDMSNLKQAEVPTDLSAVTCCMTDGSSLHESACHMCQYFAKGFPHIPPRVVAGWRKVRGRCCRARNESAAGLSGNGCRQLVTSTASALLHRSGSNSV